MNSEKYLVTKAQLLKLCELVGARKDLEVLKMLNGFEPFSEPIIEPPEEVIPQGAPVNREYGELYGMFGDSKEYVVPKKPEYKPIHDEEELGRYKSAASKKLDDIMRAKQEFKVNPNFIATGTLSDEGVMEAVKKKLDDDLERIRRAFTAKN